MQKIETGMKTDHANKNEINDLESRNNALASRKTALAIRILSV